MAIEILPIGSQGPLTPYQQLIRQQIEARGDDNHQGPTSRFDTTAEPVRDYDYRYDSRTGEIFLGEAWQTHHMEVEEFQVVYALKLPTRYKTDEYIRVMARAAGNEVAEDDAQPMPVKAELYVYEFGDAGALSRTCFSEEDGAIHKSRTGAFAEADGFGILDVQGELGPRKRAALEVCIAEPEANVIALRGLIHLTRAEKRQARRAQREHIAREEEHRAIMDDINRAHTIPLMPDVVL